ncbi:MAG: hypothetical protein D3916_09720 [Candidatus Electrothrix sp. MAN1_4]|nr:hypothetical protein [Candidatus Electrothrix sp. MAN1_4]
MNIEQIKKKQHNANNVQEFIGCFRDFKNIGETGFAINSLIKIEEVLDKDEEAGYYCHVAARELSKLGEHNIALKYVKLHESYEVDRMKEDQAAAWALAGFEWYEYGQFDEFHRCIVNGINELKRKEDEVKQPYDWAYAARAWDNYLALDALRPLIDSESDLIAQIKESIARCINNARSSAMDMAASKKGNAIMELVSCAKICQGRLGDLKDTNKLMDEAVNLAVNVRDFCEIAETWKCIGSEKAAIEAMDSAQKLANEDPSLLCVCALTWDKLGRQENAKKCVCLASSSSFA